MCALQMSTMTKGALQFPQPYYPGQGHNGAGTDNTGQKVGEFTQDGMPVLCRAPFTVPSLGSNQVPQVMRWECTIFSKSHLQGEL